MRLLDERDVYALFAPNGLAYLHVADIDLLPRVEAKKVIHAEWLMNYNIGYDCSHCKGNSHSLRNYCSDCGATMKMPEWYRRDV